MTQPEPLSDPRERAEAFLLARAEALVGGPGPVRLSEEARKAAADLQDIDGEAWTAFADGVVNEVISTRLRHHLGRMRQEAIRRERFGERATNLARFQTDTREAIASGEEPPSPYDVQYAAPGTNLWQRLGSMTRPDLLAVSRHRAGLATANAIEAIFLRALAEALPDDTTTVAEAIPESDIIAIHGKAESAELGELPDPGEPPDDVDDPDEYPRELPDD